MTIRISPAVHGIVSALLVLTVSVSCSPPSPPHGIRRIPAAKPAEPANAALWVFSDAHVHNVSSAATRLKSARADQISSVAIRPPSLDLWAEVAVSELSNRVRTESPVLPVMFLGDAADISCIDEYARFLDALGSDLVWFGAIGNHDGHYMGNFTFEPRGAEGDNSWQGACARDGFNRHRTWPFHDRLDQLERALWLVDRHDESHVDQGVLSKAHAIWLYLHQLHARGVIATDPLDCDSWLPAGWAPSVDHPQFRCAEFSPSAGSFRVFRATGHYQLGSQQHAISLVAAIDSATVQSPQRTQPWHGYLVQDIELPGGDHAVVIDTSDYLNAPRTYSFAEALVLAENSSSDDCANVAGDTSLPGRCGEVGADQVAEISGFIRAAQDARPGTSYLLLGHHPWRGLRRDSTDRLTALVSSQAGFVTYLSGHYHEATATFGTGASDHWEVNAASILDWPMQYSQLSYWAQPEGPVLQVDVHALARPDGAACPYGGPRDPGAHDQEQREMDYTIPEVYLARAFEAYRFLIANLASTGRTERCVIDGTPTVLDRILEAIDGAGALDLRHRRLLLDDIATCDREVLRMIPGVSGQELGCAGWASKLEYDTNGARERIPLSDRTAEVFRIEAVPGTADR